MKTSKYFLKFLFFFLLIAIYGCQKDLPKTLPEVSTNVISNITSTSATSGGTIIFDGNSLVSSRGICWSRNENPTISDQKTSDGSGEGTYSSSITELSPGKLYYVRAYATNEVGTAYGSQLTLTTTPILSTITTNVISEVTSSSAKSGGNITDDGGSTVIARGVCWDVLQNPTISSNKTSDGTGLGEFSSTISSLSAGTQYYVRSYATNGMGTAYGNELSFTTPKIAAIVTTADITSITATSAVSGGTIADNGGGTITSKGVCWGIGQNPTISDSRTSDVEILNSNPFKLKDTVATVGSLLLNAPGGSFVSNITGLSPGITYYVRAYATNDISTSYGEQKSFSTPIQPVSITTTAVTSLTSNSAISGGNISSDGGSPVTVRGVCWSTNQYPTIKDNHTSDGTGTGTFTSNISGLTPGTTYYIRSYGTNGTGTSYGNQVVITTIITPPSVNTLAITDITPNTAVGGGNITSDGGSSVTARGVCWSTSQNPTIADNKTTDGTGIGTFTSNITDLLSYTTYNVRSYATNNVGTEYGNLISFTTLNVETLRDCLEAFPGVNGEIVTTNLNGTIVTCKKVNGMYIYQGDIILSPTTKGSGMNQSDNLWPDGIVYYTINADFPQKDRITNGFKRFEGKTNITFKERNNEPNYIEFKYIKGDGTHSSLGMIGGKQLIVIDTWGQPGDVAHEIGHAIGLFHEQSKAGRDDYVTINFNNIKKDYEHNFIIHQNSVNTPGFDFNSLMLYGSYAFSKQEGVLPTIVVKSTGKPYPTPQREQFTESDIYLINLMYPKKPEVSTFEVSNISSTTASCGGNVYNDGGWHVYERGVCWSINQNPTVSDNKTSDGKDIGTFASLITGLIPNTTYYVRAFAINSSGIGPGYGDQKCFTTLKNNSVPTVITSEITIYNSTSATVGGNVTEDGGTTVTERGIYWSTNPLILGTKLQIGTGTGSFSTTLTGLTSNTTYYIKAYAINSQGTSYGTQVSFTTGVLPVAAFTGTPTTINTGQSVQFTDQSTNSPTSWNWSFGDGGTSTKQNPSHTYTVAGTFNVSLTATNGFGTNTLIKTSYITVNTELPTVTDIDGNVYHVVTIGTQNWLVENLKATKYNDGTSIPLITDALEWKNLITPGYSWYNNLPNYKEPYGALYNWYAVNTNRLCPANWHVPTDEEWTTLTTFLGGENIAGGKLKETGTLHWTSPNTGATNSSSFTALPGGYHYDDGSYNNFGGYGYWWSSTETIENNSFVRIILSNNIIVIPSYLSKVYGLSVRCISGPKFILPAVTTSETSNIAATTITCGGSVISDGGSSVTTRGVCWSTSQNPTISNSKTTDGTGKGSFTSSITGLTPNTTYYLRAYATNSIGTAYGNEVTFTTMGSVTDIDGNVYKTVIIGTQTWMAENLKTTRYANGDVIPIALTHEDTISPYKIQWPYNGDEKEVAIYGRLYTAYVVDDTRGVCPNEWHVPSAQEWITLLVSVTGYYGGASDGSSLWYGPAAGALKEVGYAHWKYPNENAMDLYGFCALPSGYYYITQNGKGEQAHFWTSTPCSWNGGWYATSLFYDTSYLLFPYVANLGDDRRRGYSIRCVKD